MSDGPTIVDLAEVLRPPPRPVAADLVAALAAPSVRDMVPAGPWQPRQVAPARAERRRRRRERRQAKLARRRNRR